MTPDAVLGFVSGFAFGAMTVCVVYALLTLWEWE